MGQFGIGQPVRRFEDKRLLSGNGRFQGDNNLHGQAYAYVLRSPHAHARIRKLDLAAAQAAQGITLIMTSDDLVEGKLGAFYQQVVLLEQESVIRETKPKVKDVIAEANKALGATIAVARFARLKVGEAS